MHVPGENIGGHVGCFYSNTKQIIENADTDDDEGSEYSDPPPPERNNLPEFSSSDEGKKIFFIFSLYINYMFFIQNFRC